MPCDCPPAGPGPMPGNGYSPPPPTHQPRPDLVAAIVDRVTFNAHILETGTQSYRLRTSKTTGRRKRTS